MAHMDDALARAVATRTAELGGVVRPTRLIREGHSRHRISQALQRGFVLRVRRDWIALPTADAHVVSAARTGVVLSCVTAADRRGLWVAERPDKPHVAYPGRGRVAGPAAVVHWQRAIVPRHPDLLEDEIENILLTVASCQPYEAARAIWDSALNKKLVDLAHLRRLPWTGAARRLVREASPWADSGLETFVIVRLRWMSPHPIADLDPRSSRRLPHRRAARPSGGRRTPRRGAAHGRHPPRRGTMLRLPRHPRGIRAGHEPLARGAGADHARRGAGAAQGVSGRAHSAIRRSSARWGGCRRRFCESRR